MRALPSVAKEKVAVDAKGAVAREVAEHVQEEVVVELAQAEVVKVVAALA